MKCREALELFSDLVDGDLAGSLRFRLNLHLLICRHCRRYLASYRTTVRAEKAAFPAVDTSTADEEIPDEQVDVIMNAIKAQNSG